MIQSVKKKVKQKLILINAKLYVAVNVCVFVCAYR
jgi:hypothetical protein